MKPFQLETLLNHRKRLEDIAANRLFQAEKEEALVRKKLYEENRKLDALIERTEELQARPVPILDLVQYENQIRYLKDTLPAIQKKLQEKIKTVQKRRQNLIEKSKDRQIMENLKEQQNRSWKLYLDKKEAAILDEITTVRHDRGQ